ncbi:MAG: hypothetical protein LKJ44_08335 [Bifidobacteriaceae bacterium]|jgi:tight adherence protein B|nr:hypothetical protein [Bifidobacteriaceae bacterium]MCI1979692.1 hypothetical protein [Bifidobacteriaceae bacterium]
MGIILSAVASMKTATVMIFVGVMVILLCLFKLLRWSNESEGIGRMMAFSRRRSHEVKTAQDLAQALTAVIAHMKNGGSFRGQMETMVGRNFAMRTLSLSNIAEAFSASCGVKDRSRRPNLRRATWNGVDSSVEMMQMSQRVFSCFQLSEVLGCNLSETLEIVLRLQRQNRKVDDLSKKVFAMPRSTVKLLAALPAVTLVGGEVMGAHGVSFLFLTAVGRVCLGMGLVCFASGAWWCMRLLHHHGEENES